MKPRKKASAKPLRRKVERKSAKPGKKTFLLTFDAQEMQVAYTPNFFGGAYAQGHFEFRSPYSPARRIPVSETGYRSHFAAMAEIEAAESVEAFARQIVEAIMIERSKGNRRKNDHGQLSLF